MTTPWYPLYFETEDGGYAYNKYTADNARLESGRIDANNTVTTMACEGNEVFENGNLRMLLFDGGYEDFSVNEPEYCWYTTDHLGSVRAVTDASGNVFATYAYSPYGEDLAAEQLNDKPLLDRFDLGSKLGGVATIQPNDRPQRRVVNKGAMGSPEVTYSAAEESDWQPYKFGGKESLARVGLDLYDFGARMYSPSNMRWMTMDPLAEKYYHISPYAYCAGNPVNLAVPDGMDYWILSRDGTIVNVLSSETTCMLFAVETSECYQDGTDTIFRQLAFNSHERIEDNEKFKVSFASNLSGNDALSLIKFLSDNTNVEWAMHGTTEFTIGTTHNKSSCGEWSWYGLDSRPKFSIHSHPGDEYTTDYEQRYSAGNDWRAMQNNPESKAKYYYIYFPVTETYSQLKLDYMYPMGPLPSVYNKIKKR